MSNNYDIKRNLQQPSSADIAKYQNFDALLEKYKAAAPEGGTVIPMQPREGRGAIVRRMTYLAAAAAVLAGIFFTYNWLQKPTTPALTETEYFAQKPFIHSPLKELQPESVAYKVDATKGGIYKMKTGSKLVVPTEAFMTNRGELIEGEVDLYYREMKDYVDFFVAGIPMVYDSAGVKFNLESSGMVEIYAQKNGERVQLAPGKAIEVELVAEIYMREGAALPNYNVYQLDTTSRNWTYQDIDNIQIVENAEDTYFNNNNPINVLRKEYANTLAAITLAADTRLREIEASVPRPIEPLKPQREAGNTPSIELDFTDNSVIVEDDPNTPENENERLKKGYGDAIWQIAPGTAYDEQRLSKITWETFRLRPLNSQRYELTLQKGNLTEKITVMPVLTGKDYDRAVRNYEKEHADWQAALAAWEAQLKSQKDEVNQKLVADKTAAQQAFEQKLTASGENVQDALMTKKRVLNRFKASSLGVWNCSQLMSAANSVLQSDLEDQTGEKYRQQEVYLVNKYQNTVYRFYAAEDALIRFQEGSDNLLWIVNDQRQIAVLKPADFKKATQADQRKIVLQRLETPIREEKDVRAILSFQ